MSGAPLSALSEDRSFATSGGIAPRPILLDSGQELSFPERERIKQQYKEFLAPLKMEPGRIILPQRLVSKTLIELDYSSVVPHNGRRSGRQLFQYARRQDRDYGDFVREEDNLITRVSAPQFEALRNGNFIHLSFGPGPVEVVEGRDEEFRRAIGAKEYFALDKERLISRDAAKTIKEVMKRAREEVTALSFTGDFTKRWPGRLLDLIKGRFVFGTMVGGTAGQLDMHKFFGHFNQMTGGIGALYFTLNCNRATSQQTYSGPEFAEFKGYTWNLLGTVSGDHDFNSRPNTISYQGLWNGNEIEHRYTVNRTDHVTIDGDTYQFPQNTIMITGGSDRPYPESIYEKAQNTGLSIQRVNQWLNTYGFWAVGEQFADAVFTEENHGQKRATALDLVGSAEPRLVRLGIGS